MGSRPAFRSLNFPEPAACGKPGRDTRLSWIKLLEEVIALVVDDNEGGKILNLDFPDRFHAKLWVFQKLDSFDAVLREPCRRAADRAKIKSAVFRAGNAHLRRAVAFGNHYQRAARGLELIHIGIHAPCCGRPERARGVAFWRFRRACIIDGMILEI